MKKILLRPSAPFPFDKESAVKYVEELTYGFSLWMKIDTIIIVFTAILTAVGVAKPWVLGVAIMFAIGCPTIMTAGYSIGFLRFLTIRETREIVKNKLFD
jgi:hypothetical protein